MQAQHIDSMKWTSAPDWATHIVGWVGEPQTCYWVQEIDGRYFSEEQRHSRVISFGLVDDNDEDDGGFGWEIMAARPNARNQRCRDV